MVYKGKRRSRLPEPGTGDAGSGSKADQLSYSHVSDLKRIPVSASLDDNAGQIHELFTDCSDFVIREFRIEKSRRGLAVFIDGLVNTELLNKALQALMILEGQENKVELVQQETLPVSQIRKSDNYGDLFTAVLQGDTGLLIDGQNQALLLGLRGFQGRSINEPETEAAIRGPREGYVETLRTNTAMLRRKLRTPRLKMKSFTLGRESSTNVVLAYLDNIANPELIQELTRRLELIDIDAVLESGYIEELIQDNSYSPFPQMLYTERPDTTAGELLEGRAAILIDGTPFVLIAPTTLWQLLQASEDYYERFQIGTLLRWLRYLFMVVSLTTPALYVAIITFHQDMIPTTLLLSIASAREAIPFPAIVEALIMEVTFEALREAGIRLPRTIGQAVSILGALVVGQAAVEAGIVSAPMVIVVSLTGIASFTIPHFNLAIAIRMLRFPLMILGSAFGLFGILIGLLLVLGHLASLRSVGVPYLAPAGPLTVRDMKDVVIRTPRWWMMRRPEFLKPQDSIRMNPELEARIAQQGGQQGAAWDDGSGTGGGGREGESS